MADSKKPADPLGGFNFTPPPMTATGTARQPLGPPQGYYQEQALVNPALAGFTPYVQGDEWVPAYNLTTEDRDRLKARMNQAGLYGSSGYQSGTWTTEDSNAYQIVLEAANGMGQRDPEVVINNIASEATKGPRVQGPRAPLVSKISNPDDIRAVIKDSAFSLIGQRLSAADEDRLVAMYQQREQSENQGAYGAAGDGGTVTGAPSMQAFAESQIETLRPSEVGVHQHLAAFEKILGTMNASAPETPTYKGAGLPDAGGEVL